MFQSLYAFTSRLILRTPARPFTLAIDEASIRAALADAAFMEAIYLASPTLHEECGKWQRGELTDPRKQTRLQQTLARYYARAGSRCTPFGLFAGCSLIEWGAASHLRVLPDQHRRHTRLDMHYLCALAQHLAEHDDLRWHLRYYPNTSLYWRGNEVRYVEQQHSQGVGLHQLSAIEASEPLRQAVAAAAHGATGQTVVSSMLAEEAERPQAEAFVQELLQAQVLVSELTPTVTGPEYFVHLRTVLAALPVAATPAVQALTQHLASVHGQLRALDQRGRNTAADYERIVAALTPLGVPMEVGKLFQTDATHAVSGPDAALPALSTALQATLLDALEVLACLAPPVPNQRLVEFARRFEARYEDRTVPLLEALDAESGLAYITQGSSRYSSLVHDLVVPPGLGASPPPSPGPAQRWLSRLLGEASHRYSIDLSLADLRAQGIEPAALSLAPSIGILFRPIDADRVVVESADGSSAVNLLGRFAHATPDIEALIQEITQQEQAHNPAVAFAELCHLPASRIGNLLQRPHFRALEIPYLAQSTLPAAQQVAVQDLTLAVYEGQLVLRSRKTQQHIVPRLSTAHNFDTPDALPVYQFLCDLQTQGLQASLGFSWYGVAAATEAQFLPRVTCGLAVLAAASWRFTTADLQDLVVAAPAEFAGQFAAFRTRWQLPRFFTLADGDNELFIDIENELLMRVWLEAVRSRSTVLLKEFLFDPATSPVRDSASQPYVPQCLAPLVRQAPSYASVPVAPTPAETVVRDFSLGSEWLYYKLYCGQVVADQILLEAIRPLAAALRKQGLIDNWFFIRYADPSNHLRVRWHLPVPSRIGEVIHLVRDYLLPFSGDHSIWKVQTDTYRRELARYGERTIEAAEALFGYQSQAVLNHLAQPVEAEASAEPWLWGLAAIEELLVAFGYSLSRKLALLQLLKERFAQEFGMTKTLKTQLDAKYRTNRATIEQVLTASCTPAQPLLAIARWTEQLLAQGKPEISLNELMSSYIHMLLNRLLPADARLHELVLYDFLFRHYESAQARQRF